MVGIVSVACAQGAVFIPSGGQIFSHPADTVSIFSNVINEGSFGSSPGAVVNFSGQDWQNNALTAALPGSNAADSASGGLFRFTGSQKQSLSAGYNVSAGTGPSFPNLSVENKSGVYLQDLNDLHIRGSLHFGNGYLYLNGWNTRVDGAVTGYSSQGFVVTGSDIGGGYLYRQAAVSDSLLFPIGTAPGSYTPMALQAAQASGRMKGARVFDHVYEKATNGRLLDSNYVRKTWELTEETNNPVSTQVWLQHNEADEGVRFAAFRDSSYISRYDLQNGTWDEESPFTRNLKAPGTLTTGTRLSNTYLNNRIFPSGMDSINWLSISTEPFSNITCPVADFRLWAAQRYNGSFVQLFWRTLRELNIQTFELQRRYDSSADFQTIATVDAQSMGGFSNQLLYYYYSDPNSYDGWTYYRLKMTSASGCVVYTSVQEVPWGIDVTVWPNPSPGETHIRVTGITHPVVMQVVSTWGQILFQYDIDSDRVIDIKELASATYFLVFRDPKNDNRQVTTVKLVVIHDK